MAKDSAEKKRQPHPNKQKDKRPKVACIGIKNPKLVKGTIDFTEDVKTQIRFFSQEQRENKQEMGCNTTEHMSKIQDTKNTGLKASLNSYLRNEMKIIASESEAKAKFNQVNLEKTI